MGWKDLSIISARTCDALKSQIEAPVRTLYTRLHYGSFTLPDSDSDSKPDGYIVLCRNIHIGSDLDPDPCTESFPNRYCTHFRDRYPSRGQMFIPIPYISIRGSESGSEPM